MQQIVEQMRVIEAAVKEWAVAERVRVYLAGDPVDMFVQIAQARGQAVAVIMCKGEEDTGDQPEAGVVDRLYSVVVSRGRGMAMDAAQDAFLGNVAKGERGLVELVEGVRDLIRGIDISQFTGAFQAIIYNGFAAFDTSGDVVVDAYEVKFKLRCAI